MKRALFALLVAGCGSEGAADPPIPDAPVDSSIDSPSMGCGGSAATGTLVSTITVGGVARRYLLVVPASYDSSRTYPLIFAWHGRTGNAEGARTYFGIANALATTRSSSIRRVSPSRTTRQTPAGS